MASQQRILIVDDYEDHRLILVYQLRKIGSFDILEATNGQQALDVVSQESLDLIFMNLGLPVLDGWEAVRRIRTLPSPARDVPIIAFTAYATTGDERKALDAGCDDYLTKPVIDFSLLHQKVTRLLAQGRIP
jgi:two-component system cell cycle response regulator DivK